METETRIYVADLAAYNNGILHGAWIDANQDAADIWSEVQAMIAASPIPGAEEWAIHDFEGFEGIQLSESESFERVSKLAEALAEHGGAFAAWYQNQDGDDFEVSDFEESYLGEWDSLEDYAESFADDCDLLHGLPDNLRYYFDFAAYGRDMCLNGDIWTADAGGGRVYVFDNYR